MGFKYDNDRDRQAYGYDAGVIVDGVVTSDPDTKMLVLVDEDGVAFDPQAVLQDLLGHKVRLTMISFEAIDNMENFYKNGSKT